MSTTVLAGAYLAALNPSTGVAAEPRKSPSAVDQCLVVLMDVDTGVDDALAVILSLHCPNIALVGISTVSGNTTSEQAARNTRFLLEQFGMRPDIPVAIGERVALSGWHPTPVPDIHGADGLGGVSLNYWRTRTPLEDRSRRELGGVESVLQAATRYGRKLTIVATGPLTNIARAIQKNPSAMKSVGRLLVMGGAVETPGNVTPFAEFNVHCDPEAYAIVLAAGIPVTLFPLDVTEKVRLLVANLRDEAGVEASKRQLIQDIAGTYIQFHEKRYHFQGMYMHDTLPVIALNDRAPFTFRSGRIFVESSSSSRAGQTRWARPGECGAEIEVAIGVDPKKALELFWRQLRRHVPACRYAFP